MNLKRTVSLVLALMMLCSVSVSATTLEFTMNEKVMYESDDKVDSFVIENAPYTKNGRTMVPVRIISERFGATVEWLEETKQVVITKDGQVIVLALGSDIATVNGITYNLDASPEEINGRTMVPVRFISEALGMNVDYVESTQQVLITDDPVIMTVNGIDVHFSDFQSAYAFAKYVQGIGDTRACVDFVVDGFKEIYASSTYLNYMGIYPPEYYVKEVETSLAPYRQTIYQTALTAPIAKLLAHDYFLTDFVYNYSRTDEAFSEALSLYHSEYVTVKHILISANDGNKTQALEKAKLILARINSGEDFDTLMAEYSEDPRLINHPDGYTFTKGQMVPEFEKASFALKEGQVSGIVETGNGYHIIKRVQLAEIDHDNLEYVMELSARSIYNKIVNTATNSAKVNVYKTPEELVALLEE